MTRIAAVIAAGTLALLAAACGGGSESGPVAQAGSTTATSNTSSSAAATQQTGMLAFARCIRNHGVQNFPDPNSNGGLPAGTKQIARSNPRYQAALSACRHLLATGDGPTPAERQQAMNGMQDFARCMRSHGVTNWPDPYLDVGRPTFDIHSIDYEAPRIRTAIHTCRHLMPGSTLPRMCSSLLGTPGNEGCFGGSARVP